MAQWDNILHFSSVYRLGEKEAFSGRLGDTECCYLSMFVVLDIIITIFKVTRAASLSRAFEDEEKSIGSIKLIFLKLNWISNPRKKFMANMLHNKDRKSASSVFSLQTLSMKQLFTCSLLNLVSVRFWISCFHNWTD